MLLAQVPHEQGPFVAQDAADEDDGVVGILGQGKGDFDAVGDDRQVGPVLQKGGNVEDGGAGVEEDRVPIFDHVGRPAGDALLGLGVDLGTGRKGGTDEAVSIPQYGPAAHAGELSRFFQSA